MLGNIITPAFDLLLYILQQFLEIDRRIFNHYKLGTAPYCPKKSIHVKGGKIVKKVISFSSIAILGLVFGTVGIFAAPAIPEECQRQNIENVIIGTAGADTLNGTSKNDLIIGLGGNDRISGGAGSDCLIGGAGRDGIDGGSGNDVLVGGDDNDYLSGGSGSDKMFGGDGNDVLVAGSGQDRGRGGKGIDRLFGGSGDDRLRGGAGLDGADGGTGQDFCVAEVEVDCEI